MTNAIVSDTRLAAILSDNAPGAALASDPMNKCLDALETAAVAMGMALASAESASAMAAKDWGCNFLNLVKVHGLDGDDIANRSRAALGWKDLKGEAGSVIKRRFNTWRSNVGVLSGRWSEVEADVQTELLAGQRSFITVYKALIEKDKAEAAKKKADALAKEKAAETAPATATPTPETVETVEMDASELILALTVMLDTMDGDAIAAIQGDFAAMVNAYDAKVNAILDAQAQAVNG